MINDRARKTHPKQVINSESEENVCEVSASAAPIQISRIEIKTRFRMLVLWGGFSRQPSPLNLRHIRIPYRKNSQRRFIFVNM